MHALPECAYPQQNPCKNCTTRIHVAAAIAQSGTKVKQDIRFCTSADGTRLAYALAGEGPPLVRTANWLSHLEQEWNNAVRRPALDVLTKHFSLLRYDQRGCGLSDREVKNVSFETWVDDLDCVVRAAGLRRFSMLGSSQGCAIAIAYAARYPEKVSHLMLYGGYLQGSLKRAVTEQQRDEARLLIKIIELGWDKGTTEFRQVFTTQFMPDASVEQQRAFDELQRASALPEIVALNSSVAAMIDVREQAAKVRVPTLVLHVRNDARVPFEEGRSIAALIPGARFVPLEGHNHVLFSSEPGWQTYMDEVVAFPGDHGQRSDETSMALLPALTVREQAVLELIAQGRNNADIAKSLLLSEKTVRNYVSSIIDKLEVSSRSQAIVLAREAGYGFGAAHLPR
jgi:pimeloyl-ACP methyl ester carboxylesterase/DNA-binding CsgD family transcriptional regulator